MLRPKQIAIIGAGMAGLSCATALQNAGLSVTVFEKSRGVSGRLSTRVTELSGLNQRWQCDHGAQYFTARDALFNAEVQHWIKSGVAQLWQPRLQVFDGSTFMHKEAATDRFIGYPSNTAPAKWLSKTLNIELETTIVSIQKNGKKWQTHSKEHGLYPQQFDAVLLAIPAPQAAVLLQNTATTLYNLAVNVKMQACFALMLNVNQALSCDFDGLFINHGSLSWAARDSAKPGRLQTNNPQATNHLETWILHATSQWSEAHVNDDKEAIAQQMLAEFFKITALTGSAGAKLHSHSLHRWLYADCAQYLQNGAQFDTQLNIGLCGDWLNGGKIQGAWLSGLMLAKQLMLAPIQYVSVD